jgi:hypothetical protein
MKPLVVASLLAVAAGVAAQVAVPVREMNVRQGPDSVFAVPPAEILPALAGARATGENGRVGGELVFWGFERADRGRVFFFACARTAEFDCATRIPAICPVTTTLLETREASGELVRRSCRNFAVASPGDVRPGCDDRTEENASLAVGLVTCG